MVEENHLRLIKGRDQLVKRPVLVYERIRTGQHLRIFKRYLFGRYRNELRFLGELSFRQSTYRLMLVGGTYQYLSAKMALASITLGVGIRFRAAINEGLAMVMAAAKLNDGRYSVIDWSERKGRLVVYVMRENH